MGVEFSVLRRGWLAGLVVAAFAAVVAFGFWVPVRGGLEKEAVRVILGGVVGEALLMGEKNELY